MTTTLSPADRQAFIQALRDDPVFREETRALLLTREVLELPEKLAQLTDRVDRFAAAQESFNAEQRQFNQEVTVLLGKALGGNLEAKLERSIGPILARTFSLYDVRTLQSRFTMPNQEFNRRLAQAQAEGKITADQAFQLDRADYIVYGRQTADDAEVYFVAEVSWTLGQNDITRARERADIMAAASGVNAIAVAIAQEIPPPQVQQAETAEVILIRDDGN